MSTDEGIVDLGVRDLAESVRTGTRSAVSIAEGFIERARATSSLGAFRAPTFEVALQQAEAVDRARADGDAVGPLAGVPVGLKDIFVTEGIPTSCGSRMLEHWVPPYDGTVARRLRESGAVLIGKLAMDEFAMGSSNENTPFEPVRNPWDLGRVPGGSSGGTAAAVAARACAFGMGTDTGGSIRQPASLCGVVGLKPTYGRVSRHGMIAFASSFDQAGPMTRDVRDAAVVLETLAGPDPADATASRAPVDDYLAACERGAAGLRVGVHRAALELDGLEPAVRSTFEAALGRLTDCGATLVDIDLPHFDAGIAAYYVLATAEAASNLARYDGMRWGLRAPAQTLLETYAATREEGFGDEVKRRILLGTFVLRADSYEAYFGRAMRVRTLIARDHEEAFRQCDVIASPASPCTAFVRGDRTGDPLAMYVSDVFTVGANLAGLPGISVPAGFDDAGLPIGLQLVGDRFAESTLFAAAAAHESTGDWHRRAPSLEGVH